MSLQESIDELKNEIDKLKEYVDSLKLENGGLESDLIELETRCRRAYNVLDNAFGHADAPYTPAALEAMAILRHALNLPDEDDLSE